MDFLWLDLMGDSLHHWQPMLKESPFSSQMILTFIRTDPSSSQTPAKDTTECKHLLYIPFTHIILIYSCTPYCFQWIIVYLFTVHTSLYYWKEKLLAGSSDMILQLKQLMLYWMALLFLMECNFLKTTPSFSTLKPPIAGDYIFPNTNPS